MKTSLAAPVIEFTTLDIKVYENDRITAIGRPILMLMIDPVCGCVLHEAVSVSLKPVDALIEALLSWQAPKSNGGLCRQALESFALQRSRVPLKAQGMRFSIDTGLILAL